MPSRLMKTILKLLCELYENISISSVSDNIGKEKYIFQKFKVGVFS